MNSLEHFNSLYRNSSERQYNKSLLHFYSKVLTPFLETHYSEKKNWKILDIGSGDKSLFEERLADTLLEGSRIHAIDFSSEAIKKAQAEFREISYSEMDLTKDALGDESYDLIFDSHCFHCIEGVEEREAAFKNVYRALKTNGIFASEMMTLPVGKAVSFPFKYIASAYVLEQELLRHGFKINYLMIVNGQSFVSGEESCDVLRVIARK